MSDAPGSDLSYFEFRDHMASDLRSKLVNPDVESLLNRARSCAGVDPATAAEWVERLRSDLVRHLANRKPRDR